MRILFLQSLTYPFVGVMSLSAVLRREGHDTRLSIVDMNRPSKRDFAHIQDYAPHVVAIPVYTGWHLGIIGLCRKLKERLNTIVVLGGPHPTHCPEIVRDDAVDFVCVGEGEVSLATLVSRLERGLRLDDIPGMWLTDGDRIVDNHASPLPDLHSLPPMDIDLYCKASTAILRQDNREFSLNRGCPFACTYCNEPSLKSLYGRQILRSKTVGQAMEELQYVYDRYPFTSAMFTNDNLFLSKGFAMEFLERYQREIRLPFSCQMRIEFVDREVAKAMRAAGCHMVSVGVESGSERVRREILGRAMSNEQIIMACRTLQQAGIHVNTYNMAGIPGETFSEALETVYLNASIRPDTTWCSFVQPYPGTAFAQRLISDGKIGPDIFDRIPTSFFDKSLILDHDAHRFTNLQRLFALWAANPKLDSLFRWLCNIRIPRIYDLLFLWTFYRYVRRQYKKGRIEAISKVLVSALQAWKARVMSA